jgi:WD40 repeat protein
MTKQTARFLLDITKNEVIILNMSYRKRNMAHRAFKVTAYLTLTFLLLLKCGGGFAVKDGGVDLGSFNDYRKKNGTIDFNKIEDSSPLEIVLQQAHTKRVIDMAVSPDGRFIVTASYDNTIRVWNLRGTLIRNIKPRFLYPHDVNLEITPDGSRIIARLFKKWYNRKKKKSEQEGIIYEYSMGGKLIKKLDPVDERIGNFNISPDGKYIVTYNWNTKDRKDNIWYNYIHLRDRNWNIIRSFKMGSSWPLYFVDFTPDSRHIIACRSYKNRDGWLSYAGIWDLKGNLVRDLELKRPPGIGESEDDQDFIKNSALVNFDHTGRQVAIIGINGRINVRRLDGKLIRRMETRLEMPHWQRTALLSIGFSPDGKDIWISNKGSIEVLDSRGMRKQKIRFGDVWPIRFTPDKKHIIGATTEGELKIWNSRGILKNEVSNPNLEISQLTVSPDSRRIICEFERSRQTSYKQSLIWNVAENSFNYIDGEAGFVRGNMEYRIINGKLVAVDKRFALTQKTKDLDYNRYFFTPDGKIAKLKGSMHLYYTIMIYNTDGTPYQKINIGLKSSAQRFRFSPDGDYFALYRGSIYRNALELYSRPKGKIIKKFKLDHEKTIYGLAIGPKSEYIAAGYGGGDIDIWKRSGGKLTTLRGHNMRVLGLSFTSDRRFLISSSQDKTIRVWNIETGESITIMAFDADRWVAYDSDGRFDCSTVGRDYVKFVKGFSVFSFQQFWDDFYTPGLIARFMGGKGFRKLNIKKKVNNAPRVTIATGKKTIKESEASTATVKVCAVAGDNGIGGIFLFHNRRAVDEKTRGLQVKKVEGCKNFTLQLLPGENSFIGAAYDKENLVYGRSSEKYIRFIPREMKKPNIYILAAGVSRYRDRNLSLGSPADDAHAVSRAFSSTASTLYGKVKGITLVNSRATTRNIKAAMNKIARSAGKQDTIILFFAGHGDTEKGTYYYLPYDADITDLKNTSLSIDIINSAVRSFQANKIAIFFDTCKSGAATRSLGIIAMERGYQDRKIIANLAKERGIVVFSASSKSESAYEIKSLRHGIFTYCLLDALNNRRSEIANGNLISIGKLLSFVNRETRNIANKYLKIEQTPIIYMFGHDFSLGRLN